MAILNLNIQPIRSPCSHPSDVMFYHLIAKYWVSLHMMCAPVVDSNSALMMSPARLLLKALKNTGQNGFVAEANGSISRKKPNGWNLDAQLKTGGMLD